MHRLLNEAHPLMGSGSVRCGHTHITLAHPVTHCKFMICLFGVTALELRFNRSGVSGPGCFDFTSIWKLMCIICQHKSLANPLPPLLTTEPYICREVQPIKDSTLLICLTIEHNKRLYYTIWGWLFFNYHEGNPIWQSTLVNSSCDWICKKNNKWDSRNPTVRYPYF